MLADLPATDRGRFVEIMRRVIATGTRHGADGG
jgi:hypothetical protein